MDHVFQHTCVLAIVLPSPHHDMEDFVARFSFDGVESAEDSLENIYALLLVRPM